VEIGSTTVSGTYTLSGERKSHSTIDISSASGASSGTSKTTLYTYTIPANTLAVGRTTRIKVCGIFTSTGAQDFKLYFSFGAVEKTYSIGSPSSGDHYWIVEIELMPYSADNAYVNYVWKYDNNASSMLQEAAAYATASDVAFTFSGDTTNASYPITKRTASIEVF
jgi:hypothetical protein